MSLALADTGTSIARAVSDPATPAGVVMLLGNFDGFHRGHAALLAEGVRVAARRPVGVLAVEPHPRQFFAPAAPAFRITSAVVKRETFARRGLGFVYAPRFDAAFAGQSAEAFVRDALVGAAGVTHAVVGEDFRFGAGRRGDATLLRAMGEDLGFGVSVVETVRRQEARCSSSLIRGLLREGDVATAVELLGAPWTVEVRVGAARDGRIGLVWPDVVLKPAPGRYSGRLRRLGAAAPLGSRHLTVEASGACFLDGSPPPSGVPLALDLVA